MQNLVFAYMKSLLIDFGLVVLIWLVQLIIYPGLSYYSDTDLKVWHLKYTSNITRLVIPLMMAQFIFHSYNLYHQTTLIEMICLGLIFLVWVNTFFFALPTHQKISEGLDLERTIPYLISINWYRTVLWSMVFLLTLYHWSKNPDLVH